MEPAFPWETLFATIKCSGVRTAFICWPFLPRQSAFGLPFFLRQAGVAAQIEHFLPLRVH